MSSTMSCKTMEEKYDSLIDGFKALWDKGSPMQTEWENLEKLCWAVKEISHNMALRTSAFRNLVEVDKDIRAGKRQMGQLFIETLFILWNRILLRTCLKVRDSLELLFYSINTANAYGCALAARSIIEHVALLQYFAKEIPWRNTKCVKHDAMFEFVKHLFNLTQGSTLDWDRLLSGNLSLRKLIASKSWKRPNNERIPKISILVETLEKELLPLERKDEEGHLQFLYSALCDVVHPSWGGDFIYAPQMYRDIKLDRAFDEHFKRIATLFCLPIVGIVKHLTQLTRFMMDIEPRMLATLKEE